jgi:hypothetical protein
MTMTIISLCNFHMQLDLCRHYYVCEINLSYTPACIICIYWRGVFGSKRAFDDGRLLLAQPSQALLLQC